VLLSLAATLPMMAGHQPIRVFHGGIGWSIRCHLVKGSKYRGAGAGNDQEADGMSWMAEAV
jgi:hypothetical protein